MAALAKDRNTMIKERGRSVSYLMKASTTIYAGALVSADSSGLALPSADTASTTVLGRAEETVTSAASGSFYIRVNKGVHKWDNDTGAPVVQATVGKSVVVLDDHTVSINTTNDIVAGTVDELDADGGIWVNTP